MNKSNQATPTPVAIVGKPGGLEVRHDLLCLNWLPFHGDNLHH
ncbi:MAG: hypothetical protein WA376_09860 [Terrimicrobiaceae bacterium]